MCNVKINDQLYKKAVEASKRAYSPYSNYGVGVAALTTSSKIVVGCNVENASYGLTLCAECILVGNLKLEDAGKIVELVCVNKKGEIITPCGRCRQLILEHSIRNKTKIAVLNNGNPEYKTIEELLPNAFSINDLI